MQLKSKDATYAIAVCLSSRPSPSHMKIFSTKVFLVLQYKPKGRAWGAGSLISLIIRAKRCPQKSDDDNRQEPCQQGPDDRREDLCPVYHDTGFRGVGLMDRRHVRAGISARHLARSGLCNVQARNEAVQLGESCTFFRSRRSVASLGMTLPKMLRAWHCFRFVALASLQLGRRDALVCQEIETSPFQSG
jgi:hypothetical protein